MEFVGLKVRQETNYHLRALGAGPVLVPPGPGRSPKWGQARVANRDCCLTFPSLRLAFATLTATELELGDVAKLGVLILGRPALDLLAEFCLMPSVERLLPAC